MKPEDLELIYYLQDKAREYEESKQICALCGEKCNPSSQTCGKCIRDVYIFPEDMSKMSKL